VAGGIFEAYLSGAARPFFDGHFADAGDRRRAVRRALRPVAPAVADAVAAQNARLVPSAARDAHLAALRDGAAAVLTGQQVGLFLGPLYTIYKAASAVCVARALAAESGRPVVPVFWLQTEDHDLPEIAVCDVPPIRGAPLALRLPASPDERISIAHRTLPDDVGRCLAALRAAIGGLPHGEVHLARLERHYRPGAGWGQAFAGLLGELFAEEGLVLVDPRDPALAAAAAPVHRRALTEAAALAEALAERSRALEASGFAPPVHVRPGAPLSFFHPDGPAGPRFRLAPAPDGFVEVGGARTHTREALLAALDAEPLRFSTSALLRPILQDGLLPTAACVGGPGEVAYFAQLAPLYAAYDLPTPLVVPRARLRIVEARTRRLLDRLRLAPDDSGRPEDELLAVAGGAAPARPDPAAVTRALLAPFDTALGEVRARIADLGPGRAAAVEKTRATVATAVARLAGKVEKARLHQDRGLVDDVRRLQELLCPNGVPQERVYGLPYFAARYGEVAFIARVLAAVTPFDPRPADLDLDLALAGNETPDAAVGAAAGRAERAAR
jgi:bacillithiol biosynthesis cysteine-adding enzyme BshC